MALSLRLVIYNEYMVTAPPTILSKMRDKIEANCQADELRKHLYSVHSNVQSIFMHRYIHKSDIRDWIVNYVEKRKKIKEGK